MKDTLLHSRSKLLKNIGAKQPIVLSTRIRLARNLREVPFTNRANNAQRIRIQMRCMTALENLPEFQKGYFYRLNETANLQKKLLVERHLISKELANIPEGAVAISSDQSCSVMVNEEDHLRIQVMHGGFHLKRAWEQATQLDDAIEKVLELSFSSQLGYITACPTNIGTGLRASAMLHLPGLLISNDMDRVLRALSQAGLAVRGWVGEGSEAVGGIFQVSNQFTLGASELDILTHLQRWLDSIIEQEENARLRLLEKTPEALFDPICRAYATLRYARMLPPAEAMNLISLIRLACDLGISPEKKREILDWLIIEIQPAHIQAKTEKEISPEECAFHRAKICRTVFSRFDEPKLEN